jgi:Sulfotransferase family
MTQDHAMVERKYVFVCGLPRSGTSLLGRNIARMNNCTGLQNTGVLEDEGGFLQDVYPAEGTCGGPGRFGFDRRAHLTEHSPLLTEENIARLRASWHPYWDNRKTIFVEKTPANLLMTRFLQSAFPNSYFVVLKRHPIAVGMAAQKWKVNVTSLANMFEHWLHCHTLFEQDKPYLKYVYELSYEGYVENSRKYHEEIAAFIGTSLPDPPKNDTFRYVAQWRNPRGLRVPDQAFEEVGGAYSQKYFERWSYLVGSSVFRRYYQYLAKKYEARFLQHGYSLTDRLPESTQQCIEAINTPEFAGDLYCRVADAGAFLARARARTTGGFRKGIRGLLPEGLKERIKGARRRPLSNAPTVS